MAQIRLLIFGYFVVAHLLCQLTSPYYRHEIDRAFRAISSAPRSWGRTWSAYKGQQTVLQMPESGVYASTDLLRTIQTHMALQGSKSGNDTQDSWYSTARPLIAYMTATDVIHGEGWRARAAFFMFLLAPRYLLVSSGGRYVPEYNLLHLASGDLPAVGLLSSSEDPSVGFQLTCTSPALSMGLGPQPLVRCTVWKSTEDARPPIRQLSHQLARSLFNTTTAKVLKQGQAGTAAGSSSTNDSHSDAGSSHSGSDGSSDAEETCSAREEVATWTILPDSSPEDVAQQLKEIGADPQPYLAGNSFATETGWLSSFLDIWLFFPRAPLMQLIPALTGAQQLLYAHAVVSLSYQDLAQLVRSVQHLQADLADRQAMLGLGPWGFIMMGVSVVLQLLLMTCVRTVLAVFMAALSGLLLLYMVRVIAVAAAVMQVPLLRLMSCMMDVRGTAKAAVAAGLTFLAVLRLQDVAFLLLWSLVSLLLLGFVFNYLVDETLWSEQQAARFSMVVAFGVYCTGVMLYLGFYGPTLALPAAAASSSSWLVRLAARARAAAAAAGGSGGGSIAAAAVAGASSSSGTSSLPSAVMQAAAAVRGVLRPWHNALVLLHSFSEDAFMLTVAFLVWEALGPLGDGLWRVCMGVAADAGVVLECLGASMMLLAAGASWRFAWTRFWAQVQQRLQHQAAVGRHGGMQAQLVIHAQQAAFADVGHTADALRALADELENLDGGAGGLLHQQPMFMGGRLLLPRQQQRGPRLGQHWPAPLQIGFDIDDVRDELGIEVPRGFVCPLTLDIMKQPALLISSNIAVPSSYEKEAISRWLEDSRRDPKSRRMLAPDAQLVPNFDLYRAIEDWAAHAQSLQDKHRQQQAAAAQAARAAAAAAAAQEAGGGGNASRQPSPVAAAGAGPSSAAQGARSPAAAAAAAAAGPRPTSSTGTIGSLLAAARALGTAAAAAAGAAGRQQRRQGRRRRAAAAAAAAAGQDGDDPWLLEGEEDEGYGADAADDEGAGGSDGVVSGDDYDPDDHLLSEEDAEEDLDAVHSHPGQSTAAAAGSPGPQDDATAAQQAAAAAAGAGTSGRYNLRQRRSSSLGAS